MRGAALGLALLLILAAPARAAESWLGSVQTVTLKNGLRLVLAPDSAARAVDVAMWYDAGGRWDRPDKSGLAHLFEHLMFRGSSRFPAGDHGRLVRAEGGSAGALAATDFISFFETLPPEALELAFRLESDRMTGLTITREGVEEERRLVANERAQRATPISRAVEELYRSAFPTHPYGRPLFGSASDLGRVTVEDARAFYRAHYLPGSAVVTVVGKFRSEDALDLARKYFEPIRGGGRVAAPRPPEKPQTAERRVNAIHGSPVRVLAIGWRVPGRADPDWPALSLVGPLLTRAVDAPLGRALVTERPLCYSVQGDLDSRKDASLLYVAAAVRPAADTSEVETRVTDAIEALARGTIRDEDLERAKRQIETSVLSGAQTSRGRALVLGTGQMLAGDPRFLERGLEAIRACGPADVRRAAQRLTRRSRTVLWLVPSAAGVSSGGARGGARPAEVRP